MQFSPIDGYSPCTDYSNTSSQTTILQVREARGKVRRLQDQVTLGCPGFRCSDCSSCLHCCLEQRIWSAAMDCNECSAEELLKLGARTHGAHQHNRYCLGMQDNWNKIILALWQTLPAAAKQPPLSKDQLPKRAFAADSSMSVCMKGRARTLQLYSSFVHRLEQKLLRHLMHSQPLRSRGCSLCFGCSGSLLLRPGH